MKTTKPAKGTRKAYIVELDESYSHDEFVRAYAIVADRDAMGGVCFRTRDHFVRLHTAHDESIGLGLANSLKSRCESATGMKWNVNTITNY